MPAAPATAPFKPPDFYKKLLANPGQEIIVLNNSGAANDITASVSYTSSGNKTLPTLTLKRGNTEPVNIVLQGIKDYDSAGSTIAQWTQEIKRNTKKPDTPFTPPTFYKELLANPEKEIKLVDNPGEKYDISAIATPSTQDPNKYRIELKLGTSLGDLQKKHPNLLSKVVLDNVIQDDSGSLIFYDVKDPTTWNPVGQAISALNKALKTEMAIENRQTNARGH